MEIAFVIASIISARSTFHRAPNWPLKQFKRSLKVQIIRNTLISVRSFNRQRLRKFTVKVRCLQKMNTEQRNLKFEKRKLVRRLLFYYIICSLRWAIGGSLIIKNCIEKRKNHRQKLCDGSGHSGVDGPFRKLSLSHASHFLFRAREREMMSGEC